MSEFIGGFAPILVMWVLPLAPMVYAGIVSVLEAASKPVRREKRDAVTVAEATT